MIYLINPPNPPNRVSNKDMMGGFGQCYPPGCDVKVPPIDLPYTAAVLRKNRIEVKVIDCLGSGLSLEGLISELKKNAMVMLFIRTSTSTFAWDACVSRRIKEEFDIPVVFFGPHVGVAPDEAIGNPYVDAIVLSEPEYTIRDAAVLGFRDTLGLWYKEGGRVIKNNQREPILNLDELPFPAWDLLPYMEYTIGSLLPDAKPTLFVQTSRGCPFKCSYCPYPVAQGAMYRKRSSGNVLDEIGYLVKEFDVKNILIRDAEFTLDRGRVEEICEGLIRECYDIAWRCETRVDTLDEQLLELMHKAGCIGINMGIESGSEEVCRKVGRRPIGVTDTKNIMRKCRELGIHTFCFYIIGLPGDNLSTAFQTFEYALTLDADISQFTVATPYLGTGLYEWALKHNYIESFELNNITGFEAMMRNEDITSEQMKFFRNVMQGGVDDAQHIRNSGIDKKIEEDDSIISFLISIYFSLAYNKGLRRVVVYGTRGISISRIKKIGFEILAVVDEKEKGRILGGFTVIPPELIKLLKPDAILVSPYKTPVELIDMGIIDKGTVIVEGFGKTKKWLFFLKRRLGRVFSKGSL